MKSVPANLSISQIGKQPQLLNVSFTHLTKAGVVGTVAERLACGRYEQPLTVFTPNVEQLIQTTEDEAFLADLAAADVRFPDSIGLVWGDWWRAAVTGTAWQIRERVAGVDVAENLLSEAVKHSWKVVVLGGEGKASERAVANLKRRFQGLRIWSIPVGEVEIKADRTNLTPEAIAEVNKIRPDLVLVGLGAPKQERWVLQTRQELKVQAVMVVGGAIDMWSGKVGRAPGWCRKAGLEWLYRLLREPSRWQRQLRLIRFTKVMVRN
jgi:N-acetylglucosaminyldiphosphoundecaprenol N-acetyl-beta-D-mannosaminyltransferase